MEDFQGLTERYHEEDVNYLTRKVQNIAAMLKLVPDKENHGEALAVLLNLVSQAEYKGTLEAAKLLEGIYVAVKKEGAKDTKVNLKNLEIYIKNIRTLAEMNMMDKAESQLEAKDET